MMSPRCGYWIKSSMTGLGSLNVTLTFDSSPIKGEGDNVVIVAPRCGFWIKSRMTMLCIVFTLWSHCQALVHPLIPCQALGQALVSSLIKGEGTMRCMVGWIPASAGNDGPVNAP